MAGVASLGTMLAVLFLALWFRNMPGLNGYFAYSVISVAIIFVSGGLTAAALANHSMLFGMIERITIFTFVLWMFVIGRKMAQLEVEADAQLGFEMSRSASKGK